MSTLSKVIDHDHMLKIISEFGRLKDRCYLENAGAVLFPQSLIEQINEDLLKNIYANPHADKCTRDYIDQIRSLILRHFNTDHDNYSVIFTSGTTQSLKLVVESFQFTDDEDVNSGSFIYLQDNHTSVLGLREIASEKNAEIIHISHTDFLNAVHPGQCQSQNWTRKCKNEGNTLLVYPAQSNFNGYKYPIDCIENIKNGSLDNCVKKHLCKVNCNWYVLLDAATYVSTSRLDLSKTQPDFVCMSFYKVFGYPTGLGALLIKNDSAHVLNQKKYFGGGTVDIVLSSENFHVRRKDLHERFEDGTQSFLSIIALKHCFDVMNKLIPKVVNCNVMETISHHTYYLAKDLYKQLCTLRHVNGQKAAVLYMDSDFSDMYEQGAIVTFNLLRDDGSYIGYAEFQHMADLFNINIRTGCFCNSGSCQRHLNASNKDIKDMFKAGHKCGDEIDLLQGKPTGAVRASFGYYNSYNDVDKLMIMIHHCFVKVKFKRRKRSMKVKNHINIWKSNKIDDDKICLLYENDMVKTEHYEPLTKPDIVLEELSIYPIKSCGALKIRSGWKIGSKGFEYDREWMIIQDNGVCLTQKQCPRMCLIKPKIDLKQKVLILTCKGESPLTLPLCAQENKYKNALFCQSKVCTDIVEGNDCGDEVAYWLSNVLEISFLRLIRQSSKDKRIQKKKGEGQKFLSLSNQAQYLLINKATVRWLHDKIDDRTYIDTLDDLVDRFRGNIIIDMRQELVERDWQRLIIGNHEFKVDGQCTRCQMVCIDQQTGEKTVEPLRTISREFGGKLRFGIYLSYVGTLDGSKDCVLAKNSVVTSFISDDDISR